jgi:glycerophosphoryl diester phosphodiesterase
MPAFPFEIIGHRGCEGLAPENSLAAMKLAIQLGIDRVEFDVNRARDGKLIVIHDNAVQIGTRHVPVEELTRESIASAKRVSLDSIPLLDDVLATCKGQIKIQAELKAAGMEEQLLATFKATGFPLPDTSISSFEPGRLTEMRATWPDLRPVQLVLLLGKNIQANNTLVDTLASSGIGSISLHASAVSREIVDHLHERGFRVLAWGVGDRSMPRDKINSTFRSLLQQGLDGWTSAFPDILKGILREDRVSPT